jgi:predicted RNase H-like HicB family nuclease
MRFEVEIFQEETGLFRATAVVYPEVTVTGRTEQEALGLLMEALERYMKKSPRPAS